MHDRTDDAGLRHLIDGDLHFTYVSRDAKDIEHSPWPTLTLIVSLEAIFLSTFVMIGQNRQAAFQQAKADHDFNEQELELKSNTELTLQDKQLTEQVADLTKQIHALLTKQHEQ